MDERVEPEPFGGLLFTLIDDVPFIDPVRERHILLLCNCTVECDVRLADRQPVHNVVGLWALRGCEQVAIVTVDLGEQLAAPWRGIVDATGRNSVRVDNLGPMAIDELILHQCLQPAARAAACLIVRKAERLDLRPVENVVPDDGSEDGKIAVGHDSINSWFDPFKAWAGQEIIGHRKKRAEALRKIGASRLLKESHEGKQVINRAAILQLPRQCPKSRRRRPTAKAVRVIILSICWTPVKTFGKLSPDDSDPGTIQRHLCRERP